MDRATDTYSAPAKAFHWIIAGLLLFQIPLAWIMTDQPLGPAKLGNYALHKSLGITIFAITALRLAWRLTHPAPPLPAGTPAWQRWIARLSQGVLYFLLFAMPLTGWLMSSAANVPVSFFGWFTLPDLVAPNETQAESFEEAHEMQGTVLLVLVSLHALAALHHHFLRRDGVLRSMLPFGRSGLLPLAVLAGALLSAPSPVEAADFVMDAKNSRLGFRAIAENAEFGGEFTRFNSRASFDPADPGAGRIEATVDIASVDTANGQRDELLVGSEWFNTARWPKARFETRRITVDGKGFRADGNLTIRDVSKPVIMQLTWTPEPGGAARLEGEVRLKRLDFGLGQGEWQDTRYIADGVTVDVDVRYVPAVKTTR